MVEMKYLKVGDRFMFPIELDRNYVCIYVVDYVTKNPFKIKYSSTRTKGWSYDSEARGDYLEDEPVIVSNSNVVRILYG